MCVYRTAISSGAAGDIVILDNCTVHSAKIVKETLKKCGVHFWYLPKYSPDLNPIELMRAYVKPKLRKLNARTLDELHAALKNAFDSVTPHFIKSCFSHSAYSLYLFLLQYNLPKTKDSKPTHKNCCQPTRFENPIQCLFLR